MENVMQPSQSTSIYSDAIEVVFNYDNFNLNLLSKEDGQFIYLGKVKLSPQTAKAFADNIKKNIKKYESIYGKINVFDEKAKEKENAARREVLEAANQKLDEEIERLEALKEEKIARILKLNDELGNNI